jgi:ribosomal protein S27E
MKNVTFEELSTQYPIEDVAPWGSCLIVPGAEFDPDWEVTLGDQGFRCHFTDLNGKAVTLVQKRKAVPDGKVVYVPPRNTQTQSNKVLEVKEMEKKTDIVRARARGGNNWQNVWRIEEDELLISLWNREPKLTVPKIAEEFRAKFSERSPGAISNRISALQQKGRINPRWQLKKRKGAKDPKPKVRNPQRTSPGLPENAGLQDTKTAPKPLSAEPPKSPEPDQAVKLLEEIRDLLKPNSFDFDYHCPKCHEQGTVCNSQEIWRSCPVCGAPLIVWNVEV